jgi:hypothetical protein
VSARRLVALLHHPRVCDFCDSEPAWRYHARPVVTRHRLHRIADGAPVDQAIAFAETDWLACDACRQLIANGRRDQLARRTHETFLRRDPHAFDGLDRTRRRQLRRDLRAAVRRLHDDFWRSRLGPPEPTGQDEVA